MSRTAREGDVVAIVGGSGKSTMQRCINFLEAPSGGIIVTLFNWFERRIPTRAA